MGVFYGRVPSEIFLHHREFTKGYFTPHRPRGAYQVLHNWPGWEAGRREREEAGSGYLHKTGCGHPLEGQLQGKAIYGHKDIEKFTGKI